MRTVPAPGREAAHTRPAAGVWASRGVENRSATFREDRRHSDKAGGTIGAVVNDKLGWCRHPVATRRSTTRLRATSPAVGASLPG